MATQTCIIGGRQSAYPIPDIEPGHHPHYAKYPILCEDGKWRGVDVCLPSGYLWNEYSMVLLFPFETEADCQKACDCHNRYLGFTKEEVTELVARSMQRVEHDNEQHAA